MSGSGFFGWVRSLGVVRHDGWVGGVAAGIGARLGIDPLLVRGIMIALALLGFPALVLYAIAWALLPDERGTIHAENMLRGQWDAPMVAIVIIVAVGVVPIVPWFTGLFFSPFGIGFDRSFSGVSTVIALALVALVIVAIVKASKNRPARVATAGPQQGPAPTGMSAPDGAAWPAPTVPAPTAPAATTPPAGAPDAAFPAAPPASTLAMSTSARPDVTTPGNVSLAAPDAPARPAPAPAPAPSEGFDQWRGQHEAWLGEHEAWRRRQADADAAARAAGERAREEARARADDMARQSAAAAAARRAANPRMSAAFVAIVVGVGVVAAAVTALLLVESGALIATAASLLVAAAVGGIGMALAGSLRRRSGFLTALTVVALAGGASIAFIAAPVVEKTSALWGQASDMDLRGTFDTVTLLGATQATPSDTRQSIVQLTGSTTIEVGARSGDGEIVVAKAVGTTDIWVREGAEITLDATLGTGSVRVERTDGTTEQVKVDTLRPTTTTEGARLFERTFSAAAPGEDPVVSVPIQIAQGGDVVVHVVSPATTDEEKK